MFWGIPYSRTLRQKLASRMHRGCLFGAKLKQCPKITAQRDMSRLSRWFPCWKLNGGKMWQAPRYVPRTSLPALAGLREDLCPARGQLPSWTAHLALWRSLRCRWWYKCKWVQLSAISFPILIEDTRWYKLYMPYACFGLFWCKSMSNCFVDWHPCALPWVDTFQCDLAMKSQNRISDCWPKKRCVRFIASRFLKGLHYGNRHR